MQLDLLKATTLILIFITSPLALAFKDIPQTFFPDFKNKESFTLYSEYFTTSSNYGTSGEEEAMPTGNFYQYFKLPMNFHYLLNPKWNVELGTQFMFAESFNTISDEKKSDINFSELWLKLNYYKKLSNDLDLALSVGASQAFKENSPKINRVSISDGVNTYLGKLHLKFKPVNKLTFGLNASYIHREGGLSSLLKFSPYSEFNLYFKTFFRLSYHDQRIHKEDATTSSPLDRFTVINQFNARSRVFYSPNPEQQSLELNIGKKNPSSQFLIFYRQTLSGKDSFSGFQTGVRITFKTSIVDSYKKRSNSRLKDANGNSPKMDSDSPYGKRHLRLKDYSDEIKLIKEEESSSFF